MASKVKALPKSIIAALRIIGIILIAAIEGLLGLFWYLRRGVAKWIALMLVFGFLVLPCITDAMKFHRLAQGDNLTVWYSPQWWKAPYTHVALLMHEESEYWTLNAIGSERWHVREVAVGRVIFWTVLERIPVNEVDIYEN